MKNGLLLLTICFGLFATAGCSRKVIWIYTSLPKETIADMVAPLKEAVPSADVKWFQGKSESLVSRLANEFDEGTIRADLILSSDPLWYFELKQSGKLLAYDSPASHDVLNDLKDPEHYFSPVRLGLMVIGYNTKTISHEDVGSSLASWKDLELKKWDHKTSMGSPFESGASFLAVGVLSKLFGWEYFSGLKKLGFFSEGISSSVINRIESNERPVGITLLEFIVREKNAGKPIDAVYPTDGAIVIPYSIAILKTSGHPKTARQVYDWFYSDTAQMNLIKAGNYSPLPNKPAPPGARPWAEIKNQVYVPTPEVLREVFGLRDQIKAKFSDTVLH